jgi:hypothetical protein
MTDGRAEWKFSWAIQPYAKAEETKHCTAPSKDNVKHASSDIL